MIERPTAGDAVRDERAGTCEPLGGGGADEVLTCRLQSRAADEAHQHGTLDDADRERGQQERLDRLPRCAPPGARESLRGEPPQPDGEHDDQHHARPHHRYGCERLSADAERRSATAATLQSSEDTEWDGDEDGDEQRHDAERDGHLRLFEQLLTDRCTGEQRRAEITAEESADPLRVLRGKRSVEAE